MLRLAAESKTAREEIWIRASRDVIWFNDVFGWTYAPKDFPNAPDRPFVSWRFQERAMKHLDAAIGKHDTLTEKSRDMGATWMHLVVFLWRWLFRRGQTFMVVSRTEEYVDKPGDAKSLFWKMDYYLEHLPSWMIPPHERIRKHLANLANGSTIEGEATTSDIARGDRRTAILGDEWASVGDGSEAIAAMQHATNSMLLNSTPKGTGNSFYRMRQKMPAEHILRLHWTLHPEKSRGLYTDSDGKMRSPWYDEQCSRAPSLQWIAQELDIDYASSGWQFFDQDRLEKLESEFCLEPFHRGELDYEEHGDDRPNWLKQKGGRLLLWVPLDARGTPPPGDYVVGADVATGKAGEMSSNSALSIVNRLTGEKVGEFASNAIMPAEFADYAIAVCRWFSDRSGRGALLIWEDNGPGGEFGKQVIDRRYGRLFYRQDEKRIGGKRTKRPGWASTKQSKRALLSSYATALVRGQFVNRSVAAVRECGEYVHGPDGSIYHAQSKDSDDPTTTGENHGDRVIADALACRGMAEFGAKPAKPQPQPKSGTVFSRRVARNKRRREKSWW